MTELSFAQWGLEHPPFGRNFVKGSQCFLWMTKTQVHRKTMNTTFQREPSGFST